MLLAKLTSLYTIEISSKLVLQSFKIYGRSMKTSAKAVKDVGEITVLRNSKTKRSPSLPVVPATVSLQVVGTGAHGAPSSVYMFTENSRYLFNCGEGLQRLAYEHKIKISRLEHVFLTRNRWTMVGGLPGLALTLQDAGVQEVTLHGPSYLNKILQSMKTFVVLKRLQVTTIDCSDVHDFEDHVMSVKYIPLLRNGSSHKMGDEVIMYICKLKARPGALNLQKCVEYGVPPGPLLGRLKNGEDITLENGKVVRSKDVSELPEKPSSFVILDVPEEDYLPALQSKSQMFRDLRDSFQENIVSIVHFSPDCILKNEQYKTFMRENFSKGSQHLFLNTVKNEFSGYTSAHRIQYKLNMLDSQIFPLLKEARELQNDTSITPISKKKPCTALQTDGIDSADSEDVLTLNPLATYFLRPPKGLISANSAQLNPEEFLNESKAIPDYVRELEILQAHPIAKFDSVRENTYPKILFTGTGSCIPNKSRNVSGILIQVQPNSYILLDCGEGTLGQLIRFYGSTKALDVLRNLRAIYVSHLHADHHIGLVAILAKRRLLMTSDKLLLFAPIQIQGWLDFYDSQIEHIKDSYELIPNGKLLNEPLELHQTHPEVGLTSMRTCLVRHCAHSFGVSFNTKESVENGSIKITYSGDSMPCNDLINLGKGSTILIHEATMEDELVDEAREKMHSTTSEAIQQGRAMDAKYIILTHFSQRYAKLPRLRNVTHEMTPEELRNVTIAFDNMQVTLHDLEHFHRFYPALQALFAEYTDEMDQKSIKRNIKLERKRKIATQT